MIEKEKYSFLFIPWAWHTCDLFKKTLSGEDWRSTILMNMWFDCNFFEYSEIISNKIWMCNSIDVINKLKKMLKSFSTKVIIICHSLWCYYAWKLLEFNNVVWIIWIAPSPLANIIQIHIIKGIKWKEYLVDFLWKEMLFDFSKPIKFNEEQIKKEFIWKSKEFPYHCIDNYIKSLLSVSWNLIKERIIKIPKQLFIKKRNSIIWKFVIVVTWEFDIKHTKYEDAKIVSFFNKNNCFWEHLYLPDHDIHWNWHMLFAENNSLNIFNLVYKNIEKHIQ